MDNINKRNCIGKQLPMRNPIVYCYTIYGFLFSIIERKDMPWVYSHFIQIMYNEEWHMSIFQDHIDLLNNCPFLDTYIYKFFGNINALINLIINAIEDGYYLHIFLDRYHIDPYRYSEHHAHTAIITGYDKNDNTFTVYDNFDNGKFVGIKVDFISVAKAYLSSKTTCLDNLSNNTNIDYSFLQDINFVKYNKHVITTFDPINVGVLLRKYIEATSGCINFERNYCYGINIYKRITDEIVKKETSMVKDFHLLYEHKLLMSERVKYIASIYKISHDLITDTDRLCEKFLLLRNEYIKLYQYNNDKLRYNFINKLNKLKNIEVEIYTRLIGEIKNMGMN